MERPLKAQRFCIATLAYYAALGNMPLTSTEVWQWQTNEHGLPTSLSLRTIREALIGLTEAGIAYSYNGFFSLTSTPCDAKERRWRIAETIEKRHSMARKVAFLPFIPFVRFVRVLGSVAIGNARTNSDIDLSIGVVGGRLWLTRALVTLVAHLLGVRRWGNHTANRLCFNHYTSRSEAPYGATNPAFFHIERQSIPLWPSTNPSKPLLTRGIELLLEVTMVAPMLEWALGRAQQAKIRSNAITYPPALPLPSRESTHLVFYYPRIQTVETLWKKILSSNLVNF
ncbi:MAG: hypothetical protein WDZ44_00820 [Candidatus Spechtbacterales bacterium]